MTSGNSVRLNEQIIHVCSFIWNDIYLECSQFLVWRKDLTVLIRALLKLIALKIYISIYDPFSPESAWQNIRIAMAIPDHVYSAKFPMNRNSSVQTVQSQLNLPTHKHKRSYTSSMLNINHSKRHTTKTLSMDNGQPLYRKRLSILIARTIRFVFIPRASTTANICPWSVYELNI